MRRSLCSTDPSSIVWPMRTCYALGPSACRGRWADALPSPSKDASFSVRRPRSPRERFDGPWAVRGVMKDSYLVDPASSHMLVSKIKPCMCKYELIQTVKLRMAH